MERFHVSISIGIVFSSPFVTRLFPIYFSRLNAGIECWILILLMELHPFCPWKSNVQLLLVLSWHRLSRIVLFWAECKRHRLCWHFVLCWNRENWCRLVFLFVVCSCEMNCWMQRLRRFRSSVERSHTFHFRFESPDRTRNVGQVFNKGSLDADVTSRHSLTLKASPETRGKYHSTETRFLRFIFLCFSRW